ncbi:uncharacterized protein LOC111830685 [Capsella rubella]|uniref:uncharacterized protein LOC111830685 n=1 Tax=Capsella rubella TaxID=81985 RepID=UPI000CD50F37|nr:uncharacterized protein LOC111830685 [Capsella rubella]
MFFVNIKHNLIRNRNFWGLNPANSGSWIWKKLCKLRPLARPYLVCQVGSGITASFWHDNWTGLGPLIELTGPLGPQTSGLPIMAVVRDAIRGQSWWMSRSRSRNTILTMLKAALPNPENLIDCTHDDSYSWKLDNHAPSNVFSAANTWLSLHPHGPHVSWHKMVWFKDRIPKHAFISWVVAWNRLHTRDRLTSWGMLISPLCPLCNTQNESRDHLFFRCDYSDSIWSFFTTRIRLSPPPVFMDCLLWLHNASRNKNISYITKLIFQASIYLIWKERNSRIHTGFSKPSSIIIREIQTTIRARLDPLSRSQRVVPPALSLLETWFSLF